MNVQPYLIFDGRCEEALEFYRQAVGAETVMMLRFGESPEPASLNMLPPGSENKVMHSTVRIGDSMLNASDGQCHNNQPKFDGFSLSLTVKDVAEADKAFTALLDGGTVTMPIGKTFFSPKFGMLIDRFGVHWMVYVAP